MRSLKVIGALILCCLPLAPLHADEFRPALLEIQENSPGWYAVTWKTPLKNGKPLSLQPQLPDALEQMGPASERRFGGAIIEQTNWRSEPGALVGGSIGIAGLRALPIEVIVQIDLADGTEHSAILRSSLPNWQVPERATGWTVAGSYWKIGTIHILEGFDHLLFVLALILIVPGWWMLLKTITAFTLAHSVTLALATLGLVNMPGPPTEAVIALSILFLAVEIIHNREGRITLTERYPWLVALSFGLVHGLGFAGALSEVGLPQSDIPLALLMFNVGVETGQLLFVGVVVLVRELLQRLPLTLPEGSWRLAPYAIGSIASFWVIQRVDGFI
jgi:hydrogenase/urease accessory protein HupE